MTNIDKVTQSLIDFGDNNEDEGFRAFCYHDDYCNEIVTTFISEEETHLLNYDEITIIFEVTVTPSVIRMVGIDSYLEALEDGLELNEEKMINDYTAEVSEDYDTNCWN